MADASTPVDPVRPPAAGLAERLRRIAAVAWPFVLYLEAAVLLLGPLWRDPAGRVLAHNYQDHVFFEWILTHAANAVRHAGNPLFTAELNAPHGINVMASTSVLALGVPLAPVTLLAGPHVTFALIATLALAGTAAGWYVVLDLLLHDRFAAALGGAFCGFAPAMVSQATGHPQLAGQFVIPFIVWTVLRGPRGPVRRGLLLAGLVVFQVFLGEEALFLTALALVVFIGAYAASRPRDVGSHVKESVTALATAALAAGAALAYPLYQQFFGRQYFRGLPAFALGYGSDLASYWSFARRSVAGDDEVATRLAVAGATEENTFFGWPLLVVLVAVVVWRRSDAVVRALAGTAAVFVALSLGQRIHLAGTVTGVRGPWALLDGLPVFDNVVPTRLALVVTPLVGCLIARGLAAGGGGRRWVAGALALALLPLVPTPLPAMPRPPTPHFFAAGTYREHLRPGEVVLVVPPSWAGGLHAMQWQTAAHQDFAIVGGYFLAPDPNDPKRRAIFGPAYPPTASLLSGVAETGAVPALTDDDRANARTDLAAMTATTVLLWTGEAHAEEIRATADGLFGAGARVDDVWLWRT